MTDTQEVLKSTIETQKKHIEVLQRHNELLRNELSKRKFPGLTETFNSAEANQTSLARYKKSFFDSEWFYFLHGALMGVFIHVYVHNYEVIRNFYYP